MTVRSTLIPALFVDPGEEDGVNQETRLGKGRRFFLRLCSRIGTEDSEGFL